MKQFTLSLLFFFFAFNLIVLGDLFNKINVNGDMDYLIILLKIKLKTDKRYYIYETLLVK